MRGRWRQIHGYRHATCRAERYASPTPGPEAAAPAEAAAPSTPFASACQKIALTIALDRSAPEQGRSLDAKLRNDGSSAAPLMLTGDGSSYDRRNPSVSFALTPNDVGNVGRCGINAMEDADFVNLEPGGSRKLDWLRPWQPGKPAATRFTQRIETIRRPSLCAAASRTRRPPPN